MTTRATYKSLARDLTSVLATTELSDTTLSYFVQEAVNEIYRKHGTAWPFTLTPLTSDSSSTAFEDQFDGAVVYRVAAKILKNINDTTGRADFYLQEYQLIVADMEKYYLSAGSNPDFFDGLTTLTQLVSAVRDVTGVFDPQVMSFGMLRELINVAYTELLNYRDWRNWTTYYLESLPEATLDSNYALECHRIPLEDGVTFSHNPGDGYPTIAGVLVKEVHLVTNGTSGRRQRLVRLDSLADVPSNSPQIYYTVEQDHESGGVHMLIAPKQPTQNTFVRIVTADKEPSRIDEWSEEVYNEETEEYTTVYSSTFFEIPQQFNMVLIYRAAQLVLQQVAPQDPRIEIYGTNFASLLDAFVTYDQLNHDTATFSIGEQGKEETRYIPWFKPS
jgi:hypothetical protein